MVFDELAQYIQDNPEVYWLGVAALGISWYAAIKRDIYAIDIWDRLHSCVSNTWYTLTHKDSEKVDSSLVDKDTSVLDERLKSE